MYHTKYALVGRTIISLGILYYCKIGVCFHLITPRRAYVADLMQRVGSNVLPNVSKLLTYLVNEERFDYNLFVFNLLE
jgi:hypothetical protein